MGNFAEDLRWSQSLDPMLARIYSQSFKNFTGMSGTSLKMQSSHGDRWVYAVGGVIFVEEKVDKSAEHTTCVIELLGNNGWGCISKMLFEGTSVDFLLYIFPNRGVAHLFPWLEFKQTMVDNLGYWLQPIEESDQVWWRVVNAGDSQLPALSIEEYYLTRMVPGTQTLTFDPEKP